MFIKHNNKIYKEVVLKDLTKEELLEVAKWVEVLQKEIVYKDRPSIIPNINYPRDNPNRILYSVQ